MNISLLDYIFTFFSSSFVGWHYFVLVYFFFAFFLRLYISFVLLSRLTPTQKKRTISLRSFIIVYGFFFYTISSLYISFKVYFFFNICFFETLRKKNSEKKRKGKGNKNKNSKKKREAKKKRRLTSTLYLN